MLIRLSYPKLVSHDTVGLDIPWFRENRDLLLHLVPRADNRTSPRVKILATIYIKRN